MLFEELIEFSNSFYKSVLLHSFLNHYSFVGHPPSQFYHASFYHSLVDISMHHYPNIFSRSLLSQLINVLLSKISADASLDSNYLQVL